MLSLALPVPRRRTRLAVLTFFAGSRKRPPLRRSLSRSPPARQTPLGGGPRAECPSRTSRSAGFGRAGTAPRRAAVRWRRAPLRLGGPRSGTGVRPEGGGTVTVGLLIPETGRSRDQRRLAPRCATRRGWRSTIRARRHPDHHQGHRRQCQPRRRRRLGRDPRRRRHSARPRLRRGVAAVGNVARGAGVARHRVFRPTTRSLPRRLPLELPAGRRSPPDRELLRLARLRLHTPRWCPPNQYGRRAANGLSRCGQPHRRRDHRHTTYTPGEASYSAIMQLDGKQLTRSSTLRGGGASMRGIANLLRNGPPPPPPRPPPLTEEEIAAARPRPPARAAAPRQSAGIRPDRQQALGRGLDRRFGFGRGRLLRRARDLRTRAFLARFNGALAIVPARIATLGYDALSLVAILSSSPSPDRFSYANIADPNGFSASTGSIASCRTERSSGDLRFSRSPAAGSRLCARRRAASRPRFF